MYRSFTRFFSCRRLTLLCGAATLTSHLLLPLAARADGDNANLLPATVTTARPTESGPLLAVTLVLAGGLVAMERACAWRLRLRSRAEADAVRLQDCLPSTPIDLPKPADYPAARRPAGVSRVGNAGNDALLILAVCLLGGQAGAARAGNIINTNLPTGTTIINIDGRADGAAGNDPGNGKFSQPYSTDVSLAVGPGTYTFNIIDPADAQKDFPGLAANQLATIYTAWTFNNPWTTDYIVFDRAALSNPNAIQLFDGGDDTANAADTYSNAQAAYDAAVAGGYTNYVRPGARTGTTYQTSYTFPVATTLLFAVPDYVLGDNAGGMSVVVQAVPEPGTSAIMGAGALLTLFTFRRRGTPSSIA